MESKEELINNLNERFDYLEGESYQLNELLLTIADPKDNEEIGTALAAINKALRAINRLLNRLEKQGEGK